MIERPIPFQPDMVRATLSDIKTQTRRIMRVQPPGDGYQIATCLSTTGPKKDIGRHRWVKMDGVNIADAGEYFACPYGTVGDRLWGREAWRTYASLDNVKPSEIMPGAGIQYEAGGNNLFLSTPLEGMGKLRPGMFMPRWASRLLLEVTELRCERLQDISEADAVAEGVRISSQARRSDTCYGIYECQMPDGKTHFNDSAYALYRVLLEQINGAGTWDANPMVWVVKFSRVPPLP